MIGFLSGIVGAGGAFLLMPVLVGVIRNPLRLSIGTSLAVTVASALTGFVGKLLTAQVPLGPTLAVVAGGLGGAAIGARLSGRAPVGVLRGVLGALIALTTLRVWADVLFGSAEGTDRALRLRDRPAQVHRLPRLHGGVQGGEPRPGRRRSGPG